MLAKYERRVYRGGALVWAGRYRNLNNLPHWHNECELIYCDKGCASVFANNKEYTISEGYCFFCPSECIHCIKSDEKSYITVALYDKSLTSTVTDVYDLDNPVFFDENNNVKNVLGRILNEYNLEREFYGSIVNSLIAVLVFYIFRNNCRTAKESQPLKPAVVKYKRLLSLIEKHPELSFAEAAKTMDMSEAYFSKFFKGLAGMTYTQYANSIRVAKAIDLMGHNSSITSKEIMEQTGFSTLRNFNRVFKSITGYSPKNLPSPYVPKVKPEMQKEDAELFNPTLEESELLNSKM